MAIHPFMLGSMITRLAHVCLNVRDIQRTIAFYRDALGLPLHFQFTKGGRVMGAYFRAGRDNFVEAFEKPDVVVQNSGITHFCLETPDIDAAIRSLTAKGVACTEKKLGCDRSWQTWLRDPDGNAIELHQYTAQSRQFLGGDVEVDW